MKLLSEAITEPLTLDEAKLHLRIESDFTAEDDLLERLITTAREQAEAFTWQVIPEQEWEIYLQSWPSVIELPGPLKSVDGVYYTPDGGSETEFSDVAVDLPGNRVLLATDKSWPTDSLTQVNPIRVQFTSGYTTAPASLKAAMLLIIGHLYAHREDVIVGTMTTQLPKSAEHLMWPYRAVKF